MTFEQAQAIVAERRKDNPPLPLSDEQVRVVRALLGPIHIKRKPLRVAA